MIKISVTEEAEKEALRIWAQMESTSAPERRFSSSAWWGILSEAAIALECHKLDNNWLSLLKHAPDAAYDFDLMDAKIELKTAIRNIDPIFGYTAKIPENYLIHSESNGTSHLLFASINKRSNIIVIIGIISLMMFRQIASFYKKGEIPPGDIKPRNCNTFQIKYSNLFTIL